MNTKSKFFKKLREPDEMVEVLHNNPKLLAEVVAMMMAYSGLAIVQDNENDPFRFATKNECLEKQGHL